MRSRISWRPRSRPAPPCSSGSSLTIMGGAHLDGVLTVATRRGYDYDFRLAGLLLVGSTLVFGGALCLSAVRGLARGRRTAWGRALSGTLLLLLVLVLMSPVQPKMAPGLSVLAAVNLIALLAARRRLEPAIRALDPVGRAMPNLRPRSVVSLRPPRVRPATGRPGPRRWRRGRGSCARGPRPDRARLHRS